MSFLTSTKYFIVGFYFLFFTVGILKQDHAEVDANKCIFVKQRSGGLGRVGERAVRVGGG